MKNKQIRTISLVVLVFLLGFFTYQSFEKHKVVVAKPEVIKIEIEPIAVPIVEPVKHSFDSARNEIHSQEIKQDLEYLASDELEGRMSGKKGNIIAAEFIKKRYESYGLKTMYDKFKIERVNPGPKHEIGNDFTQNVYAWIEGSDPKLKNEIVIVGAHFDHIGYGKTYARDRIIAIHPGADDNASGTAALLAIAKAFSLIKHDLKRTIVFQSYSAEEMGLIGSKIYCNNPKFPIEKPDIKQHVFALNMDMIGTLNTGIMPVFYNGDSSIDISYNIKELNKKYAFADKITSQKTGGSDHASFYNKKIPIAFLHTGLHSRYHTIQDKSNFIDYDGIEKIAKYAFELTWKISQSEVKPKFNYTSFKEMEYIHDHGHNHVHE